MTDRALSAELSPRGSTSTALPAIRRIAAADLGTSLRLGWDDFRAIPSQLLFLCIIYPVAAVVLWKLTVGHGLLPLFYPLASGFALVGPITAIGLYAISLRRERGQPCNWRNCFDVLQSPALASIVVLSLGLLVVFVLWIAAAEALCRAAFGATDAVPISDFVAMLFTTSSGWMLIVAGNLVGLLFAACVLAISVVSFPMMLDRNADVTLAVRTSVLATLRNARTMALWGVIVAVLLALGTVLGLVGLAIALPVLGHATWHLYRRVIAP